MAPDHTQTTKKLEMAAQIEEAEAGKEEDNDGFFITDGQPGEPKISTEDKENEGQHSNQSDDILELETKKQLFDEDIGRVKVEKFKARCRRHCDAKKILYEEPMNYFEAYKSLKSLVERVVTDLPPELDKSSQNITNKNYLKRTQSATGRGRIKLTERKRIQSAMAGTA